MKKAILDQSRRMANWMEQNRVSRAVRRGLIMAIPMLMIGSIALTVLNLPISEYQHFLDAFLGGALRDIFGLAHSATFDFLSIIFVVTISYSYAELSEDRMVPAFGVALVSLGCFLIFSGFGTENFDSGYFGVNGMFTAVLTAILSSALFLKLRELRHLQSRVYADGTDENFYTAVTHIVPAVLVLILFAVLNYALAHIFHVANLTELLSNLVLSIFEHAEQNLATGILYVFFIGFFWFFGVHGGNVIDQASQQFFALGAIGAGVGILNKTFFDVFALMGGSGATLCLVIAILLFCRRKGMRELAYMGIGPTLFNVNEFVMFGLPVVLNPLLLIPFVLTPVVLVVISYAAIAWGLVPEVTRAVEWTTPVFISGYLATGSIAGSVLQLVNIVVGVLFYFPFIRFYERRQTAALQRNIHVLTQKLLREEAENDVQALLDAKGELGSAAKMLATDLKYAIRHRKLQLFFQPQVEKNDAYFGAEALLRWKHDVGGYIAPPLILALARESGMLRQLEQLIFDMGLEAISRISAQLGKEFKISVNLTAASLKDENFIPILESLVKKHRVSRENLLIEVTESTALSSAPGILEKIAELRQLGYGMVIDDFGMGHTSLLYLQNNQFDMVKLDGSIVRDILKNDRSCDIISSILFLGKSLKFSVLAEFVEVEPQRQKLLSLGCNKFQGYLYSPAVPEQELIELVLKSRRDKE